MYKTTPLVADELKDYDYRKDVPKLDVPVYFVSGDYDYNTPWELVKDYANSIEAPDKNFYLIPNAAHSPLWENWTETGEVMRQIKEKNSDE